MRSSWIFLKRTVETTTIPIATIAVSNGVNGRTFTKLYKEKLSGYRQWKQLYHAEDYVLHGSNVGEDMSIDETSLSNGEVYTVVTDKAAKGRKGALVAMIKGVASDNVIGKLRLLGLSRRRKVKTVTADLSGSMKYVASRTFPAAEQISDRFHVQQLMSQAIDDMRIELRWEVLARAKYILTKNASKWTKPQQWRADIIFEFYPELKKDYDLAMDLTAIFNQKVDKDVAMLNLARWYDKVDRMDGGQFRTVTETFRNHYDTILNYFIDRSTNAGAESFNAKVKAFRSQFRGVTDIPFFLFRLSKLCA